MFIMIIHKLKLVEDARKGPMENGEITILM